MDIPAPAAIIIVIFAIISAIALAIGPANTETKQTDPEEDQ